MVSKLADGGWLTAQRMRAVALISGAVSLIGLLYLFATANGTLDSFGRPLGTDFSNVYAAGRMALEGQAAAAWDWPRHYAVQQAVHGDPKVPFYGWHYPPPFLMVAALLAMLPYVWALILWQSVTLTAAASLARRILPARDALLFALTAPVVFVCLGHGQNGFLTAFLLGGGLLLLDRRPFVAGLLLGCLIYKPQFALLIGPLLLIGGHWRAIAGAALAAGLLAGTTLILWGLPVWSAFLHSLTLTRQVVIESGGTGWEKIQSPFAMVRMWGGGLGPAYAVQSVTTLLGIGIALWLARFANPRLRNAAAMAAALLSTPYVLDYDYVVLGIGVAFLLRDSIERGFLSWEKSLVALVWISPLFARQLAALTFIPLGQASAVIVLGLAFRRGILFDGAADPLRRTWPFRRSHAGSAR